MNIIVDDISDETLASLESMAETNSRSLNDEIIHILEEVLRFDGNIAFQVKLEQNSK